MLKDLLTLEYANLVLGPFTERATCLMVVHIQHEWFGSAPIIDVRTPSEIPRYSALQHQ